jgi:hypothetical protein
MVEEVQYGRAGALKVTQPPSQPPTFLYKLSSMSGAVRMTNRLGAEEEDSPKVLGW